jgi:putative membrane protein
VRYASLSIVPLALAAVASPMIATRVGHPVVLTAATAAAPLTDANIAAIFDAANTFDIETGAIAAKKGSTQAVRDFALQLERDHSAVRQQGRDLVKKLKVNATLPEGSDLVAALAKGHADAMKTLEDTPSGLAFDRAFLQHEVGFHKAVIAAVGSTLLPAIRNAELKSLVTTVAPAFQAHMAMAQHLLDHVK